MRINAELFIRTMFVKKLRKRLKRKSREVSIRPIFLNRFELGESSLVRELREDPYYHHRYFRMSIVNFDLLLQKVTFNIKRRMTHCRPISPLEKLAITLRYLATGNSQISMAMNYRITPSSISNLLRQTMQVICDALEETYLPPPSEAVWTESEEQFSDVWNFPNCCGAIDGKHIRIRAPSLSGSNHFNYKGHFSVALLAVVDASYRFLVVDIGASGSQSDGGVHARSTFGKALQDNSVLLPPPKLVDKDLLTHFIVGDDAFPLRTNLIKPIPGKQLTPQKRIFNYRLSRARMMVENSFGILAARWRIFQQTVHAELEFIKLLVKTCVISHNFLLQKDDMQNITIDRFNDEGLIRGNWRENIRNGMSPLRQQGSNNHCSQASKIRESLMHYCNGVGRVAWQNKIFS